MIKLQTFFLFLIISFTIIVKSDNDSLKYHSELRNARRLKEQEQRSKSKTKTSQNAESNKSKSNNKQNQIRDPGLFNNKFPGLQAYENANDDISHYDNILSDPNLPKLPGSSDFLGNSKNFLYVKKPGTFGDRSNIPEKDQIYKNYEQQQQYQPQLPSNHRRQLSNNGARPPLMRGAEVNNNIMITDDSDYAEVEGVDPMSFEGSGGNINLKFGSDDDGSYDDYENYELIGNQMNDKNNFYDDQDDNIDADGGPTYTRNRDQQNNNNNNKNNDRNRNRNNGNVPKRRAHTVKVLVFLPNEINDFNVNPDYISSISRLIISQLANERVKNPKNHITKIFDTPILDHVDFQISLSHAPINMAHVNYHNLLLLGKDGETSTMGKNDAYPNVVIGPMDTESVESLLYMTKSNNIPVITVGPLTNRFLTHSNSDYLMRLSQPNDEIAYFLYWLFWDKTYYAKHLHYIYMIQDSRARNTLIEETADDVYQKLRRVKPARPDKVNKNMFLISNLIKEKTVFETVNNLKLQNRESQLLVRENLLNQFAAKNNGRKILTLKEHENLYSSLVEPELPALMVIFGNKKYLQEFLIEARPSLKNPEHNIIYWIDILEETRPQLVKEDLKNDFTIFDEEKISKDPSIKSLEKFVQVIQFYDDLNSQLEQRKSFYSLFQKFLKEQDEIRKLSNSPVYSNNKDSQNNQNQDQSSSTQQNPTVKITGGSPPVVSNRFIDAYYDAFRLLFKAIDSQLGVKKLDLRGDVLAREMRSIQGIESANGRSIDFKLRKARVVPLRAGYFWGLFFDHQKRSNCLDSSPIRKSTPFFISVSSASATTNNKTTSQKSPNTTPT